MTRPDIRPALHRAACLTEQRTADERRIAKRGRRGWIAIAVLVGMAAVLVAEAWRWT